MGYIIKKNLLSYKALVEYSLRAGRLSVLDGSLTDRQLIKIDTGFDGYLILPESIKSKMGSLDDTGYRKKYRSVTGGIISLPMYKAKINILGRQRTTPIHGQTTGHCRIYQ